jgi:ribonuclease Z
VRPLIHPALTNGPGGDPALYLDFMFQRRAILFDLGEINVLSSRKLLRVEQVFVSHAHMDHFAGFDRLLRIHLGREKHIALYGPVEFIDRVEHKLHGYTWNVIDRYPGNLVLDVCEIGKDHRKAARFQSRSAFTREALSPPPSDEVVFADHEIRVRAAALDHETSCLAFTLEETSHVNVWKNRLAERGYAVGPWLRQLKDAVMRGDPDESEFRIWWRDRTGRTETSAPLGELKRTLLQIVPGQKIAYVVDARYHPRNKERIVELVRGADVLYIEAVFLECDSELAAHKNHLTARQAGEIARVAGVKTIVPFHFSPRYAGRENLLIGEAELAFGGGAQPAMPLRREPRSD